MLFRSQVDCALGEGCEFLAEVMRELMTCMTVDQARVVLSGKGACGQAGALRWSGRRCATTALRCSVSWPVAELTALTSFATFKQAATSQLTKRAARAATSPVLLVAPEARRNLPARAFAGTLVVLGGNSTTRASCRDAPNLQAQPA